MVGPRGTGPIGLAKRNITGRLSQPPAVDRLGDCMMKMTRSDLITAEIVRNYLETVSAEMSRVVENTSISPIFSETHDYSCGIFYFDDNGVSLVARAQSIPVHIIAALKSVEIALDIYK